MKSTRREQVGYLAAHLALLILAAVFFYWTLPELVDLYVPVP